MFMKQRFSPTLLITLSFFFCLLMIISCKKETSQSGDPAQEEQASMASSESDGEAEMIFSGFLDDAIGASDEVGMAGIGVFGVSSLTNPFGNDVQRVTSCFVVTTTHLNPPNIFPIKVVVDFGTAGCLGNDGHTRRGKIITEYTGRLIFAGSVATTTFDGFYIDSIKVEGTHRVQNTSSTTNSTPNRQFTVDVINGKLSKPSGNYTEWSSHKVITQIEGLVTPDYARDDAFRIEGTAHGRVRRNDLVVAWDATVVEPLIKRFNCRWITKGRIRTVRLNNSASSPWVAVLDFGNGDCDNQAVITINGVPHQITLH